MLSETVLFKIKVLVYTLLSVFRLAPGKISTLISFMVIFGFSRTLSYTLRVYIPYCTGIPITRFSRITPYIYIGPQHSLYGLQKLEHQGINACLNIRQHFDDAEYGLDPDYYCFPARGGAPFIDQLNVAVKFIEDMINKGNKVYVHCENGLHKCAAVAVAYLLKQGYNIDKAIKLVKSKYPDMYIYPNYIEDLKNLENQYVLIQQHSSSASSLKQSSATLKQGVGLQI